MCGIWSQNVQMVQAIGTIAYTKLPVLNVCDVQFKNYPMEICICDQGQCFDNDRLLQSCI